MKAKTEELLYLLLWTCECALHPTCRNMTESFEGWAYRNGLLRRIQRLERERLLKRTCTPHGGRLTQLTEAGRLQALGGRDPDECWKRSWDGQWRLVLFDVPEAERTTRNELRAFLRRRGFGCLQGSVWVSPHPVEEEQLRLAEERHSVKSLLILNARPWAGATDAQIVAGAWNFASINARYEKHGVTLARRPRGKLATTSAAEVFRMWLREERSLWTDAIRADPLLPECLWPPQYSGASAWRNRARVMAQAAAQMRGFVPPSTGDTTECGRM